VMSYDVSQRAREIGIRLALGADRSSVMRMVVGGGLRIGTMGVAAGAILALAATRLIAGLLFGVSAADPSTYGMLAGLLLTIAVAAAYLPARRAARINPRALMDV
jgi:putative ABC transport system permease protein